MSEISRLEAEILERRLCEVAECKCGGDLDLREVSLGESGRLGEYVKFDGLWACVREEDCEQAPDGRGLVLETERELTVDRARQELEDAYQEHRESVREKVHKRVQERKGGHDA